VLYNSVTLPQHCSEQGPPACTGHTRGSVWPCQIGPKASTAQKAQDATCSINSSRASGTQPAGAQHLQQPHQLFSAQCLCTALALLFGCCYDFYSTCSCAGSMRVCGPAVLTCVQVCKTATCVQLLSRAVLCWCLQSTRLRDQAMIARGEVPPDVEQGSELALFIIDGECPRWVWPLLAWCGSAGLTGLKTMECDFGAEYSSVFCSPLLETL
jgi:hypothetical protein